MNTTPQPEETLEDLIEDSETLKDSEWLEVHRRLLVRTFDGTDPADPFCGCKGLDG